MNQVNLMNLLYAVPETTAPQLPGGQQSSQADAGAAQFMANLQQELWAAQMPQFGVGLLSADAQGDSGSGGLMADFSDLITEGLPTGSASEAAQSIAQTVVDGVEQLLGTEEKTGTSSTLIDVLTMSLKQAIVQILDGNKPGEMLSVSNSGAGEAIPIPVADSQATAQPQSKTGLAMQAPVLVEESAVPQPGIVSPNTVAEPTIVEGNDAMKQSPELMLADIWRIAAGILKGELMLQGVVVEVSAPELQTDQASTKAAPWALVSADGGAEAGGAKTAELTQAHLSKALVANMPRAATIAPVVAVPGNAQEATLASDAPESIRWFAQPANSSVTANVEAQPQQGSPIQPMVSELAFAGETKLKVSLEPTIQPTPVIEDVKGEPIVLNLRVALAGEANAALEAKLTLLPVVNRSVLPQAVAPAMTAETESTNKVGANSQQGFSTAQVESQSLHGAKPIGVSLDNLGTAPTVMSAQAEPMTADVFKQGSTTTLPNLDRAVATTLQAMTNTGEQAANTVPLVVPKPGRTTGLENAKVADEIAVEKAAEGAHRSNAESKSASNVFQLRKATFASIEQRQSTRLQTLSQLNNSSVSTPIAESQTGLTPVAGLATQDVPAQLLQFSNAAMEFKTPGGLNYQELANRLMDKVADAKAQGNGVHSAKLTLNPANLGQMSINIAVQGNSVALQIAVAAGVPKALIKDSLDALQLSLEESGLEVLEFKVDELGSDHEQSGNQQQTADTHSTNHQQVDNAVEPVEAFKIDPELFGTAVPA